MEYTITREESESGTVLRLNGSLTIYTALEQKAQLLDALHSIPDSGTLIINLSDVNELDSAGIQLLMFLKKESKTSGKTLRLSDHSPVILRVMDIYGLVGFFSDCIRLSKKDRSHYDFKYGVKKSHT